jgi:hypothetical protein
MVPVKIYTILRMEQDPKLPMNKSSLPLNATFTKYKYSAANNLLQTKTLCSTV